MDDRDRVDHLLATELPAESPADNLNTSSLKLMLYFMPVFGIIPALWTLNQDSSTKAERNASRVAVKLALTWFASYMLFDVGAQQIDGLHLPLLLTSSLITSGYFVMNLWLVILLWQRKSIDVPFFGRVDRLD